MEAARKSNPSFHLLPASSDMDLAFDDFPTQFVSWNDQPFVGPPISIEDSHTFFGYVYRPTRIAHSSFGSLLLQAGMYFSLTGPFGISHGSGFCASVRGHQAFNTIGGPIEESGRLKYIDGCTDSLLISPIKKGDPCLNLLWFPPQIHQTSHTHPSNRIGMVVSGRGRCITPTEEIPLLPGVRFVIPKDGQHCFYTDDSEMRVIAMHPDSDVGSTDEIHAMVTRTMVGGVSASLIPGIRTA